MILKELREHILSIGLKCQTQESALSKIFISLKTLEKGRNIWWVIMW